MNSRNNLEESMYDIIQTGLNRGFSTTQIKKKFNEQIQFISNRTKDNTIKKKKRKNNHKPVRVPIWVSDSSDDD